MKIQGKTILQHMVDFLKFSSLTDRIIVATTTLSEDDVIVKMLDNMEVDYYRGSTLDVLGRYFEAAKHFQGDLIVRITSDNPLVDPTLIDEVTRICRDTKCDYVTNLLHETYPKGYSGEVLTFSTLKKLHETQHEPLNREHVTYHIRKNPQLYNVKEVFALPNLARPSWRLTVDYLEDFHLISEIFKRLYKPGSFITYESVVNLLDANSELLKINAKYANM